MAQQTDSAIFLPFPYQSPIALNNCDIIKIEQCINVCGHNHCATFNPDTKVFEVHDKIILKVNSKRYQLEEYHFHVPSEHKVNHKKYPSEIHYVFVELGPDRKYLSHGHKCADICGGGHHDNQ